MTTTRTYLDHNATALLVPQAREAMLAVLDLPGNASSVHAEGRRVRAIIDAARDSVAKLVNAKPSEVVFTSGATEANVWALSGRDDVAAVCGIEHDSVLTPLRASGRPLIDVPAGREGRARLEGFSQAARTGQIILQWANNETGVVQPVGEAARFANENGWAFHVDAAQAAGRVKVDFQSLGATTMSLSAHKLGGPKGAGALIIRDGANLKPLIAGGGQERRRRGGTENIAGIAGFGAAAKVAAERLSAWSGIEALRNDLEREVVRRTPAAMIVGVGSDRLPNTSCIALPGYAAETLVIKFDLAGIAISAGSACSSGKVGASHVLLAMGLSPDLARSAIRISLGLETTRDDISRFLEVWSAITTTISAEQKVA